MDRLPNDVSDPGLRFGPYRIASPRGPLCRGATDVHLPPKALAVLWMLASRCGEVVTKVELFDKAWPGVVVTDGVIAACLKDLRHALDDDPKSPHYIATVHRVGYRFIAQVTGGIDRVASLSSSIVNAAPPVDCFVGRKDELARLHAAATSALQGQRRLIFVTAEAGMGKTALVDTFIAQLADGHRWRVAQGHCIEHFGPGEPYLPLLEALGRACFAPDGEPLLGTLRQRAPHWVAQLPAAATLRADPTASSQPRPECMARELADALDVACSLRPMVLMLEDIHWSDASTVTALTLLARRRDPARLLLIATLRAADLLKDRHPLLIVRRDLVARGLADELTLHELGYDDVRRYVGQRLSTDDADLAAEVFGRSDGLPLFMTEIADFLDATRDGDDATGDRASTRREAVQRVVPGRIRDWLDAQLDRLDDLEREVLQAASVVGARFASASVAAALDAEVDTVDAVCEALASREQFIASQDRVIEWPDGTRSNAYAFRHALHREVVYGRLRGVRRMRLHRAVGLHLQAVHAERSGDIAGELAMHFARAGDVALAIEQREKAARNALWRSALAEAIDHVRQALDIIDNDQRFAAEELRLQLLLGGSLMSLEGYSAPEAGRAFARARELAVSIDDEVRLFSALSGLAGFHLARAEIELSLVSCAQMRLLLERTDRSIFRVRSFVQTGSAHFFRGDLADAESCLEASIASYDPEHHHPLMAGGVTQDPKVMAQCFLAITLWLRGKANEAFATMDEALQWAHRLAHPFSTAWAYHYAAELYLHVGDAAGAERHASNLSTLATEQGFVQWSAAARLMQLFACVEQGRGAEALPRVFDSMTRKDDQPNVGKTRYLALLGRALMRTGSLGDAATAIETGLAFARQTGERCYESELLRLKGAIVLAQAAAERGAEADANAARTSQVRALAKNSRAADEAAFHFTQAIEVARKQGADLLEGRAQQALDLARPTVREA